MKLTDLNTSEFIFDPQGKDFEGKMEEISAFQFKVDKVNKKKILTYLTLMYDKNSELRKTEKEYGRRKKVAAIMAGWNLHEDGRFFKGVEGILLGENKNFNRAVMEYLFMSMNVVFVSFALHQHLLYKVGFKILTGSDVARDRNDLKNIKEALQADEEILLGGGEVLSMREAIYERGKEYMEERYQQEDVVDRFQKDGLDGWSPYGDYKPEGVKFAGEQIPEK